MNNKRIEYIDQIKGVLIVLMVFFHIDYVPKTNVPFYLNTIFNLGVFFVIAGFFLKDEKIMELRTFARGKLSSLYKPAMYICIPVTLLHNFFFQIGWYSNIVSYAGKNIHRWSIYDYILNFVATLLLGCREPLIGAMWFVFCLIIAIFIYAMVTFLCSKLFYHNLDTARFCFFLLLQVFSCVLTEKYCINIPRFSNACSIVLLIYIGRCMYQRYRYVMENKFVFAISAFFLFYCICHGGSIIFNTNSYSSLLYLDTVCLSSTVFMNYLFMHINLLFLGKILSCLGNLSFYIMGLHMLGFKIMNLLLICLGIEEKVNTLPLLKPVAGTLFIMLGYLFFGLFIPVLFVLFFRTIHNKIKSKINYIHQ